MPILQEKIARVQAVQNKYSEQLMKKHHVVGLSIGKISTRNDGTDEIGLIVLVQKQAPNRQLAPEDRIPDVLDGVPVVVREVGRLEAL